MNDHVPEMEGVEDAGVENRDRGLKRHSAAEGPRRLRPAPPSPPAGRRSSPSAQERPSTSSGVLADIPERKIANVHPVDDERTGDPEDVSGIVWTQLLVLDEDSDTLPLDKMVEGRFEEGCGLRRQPHNLVSA